MVASVCAASVAINGQRGMILRYCPIKDGCARDGYIRSRDGSSLGAANGHDKEGAFRIAIVPNADLLQRAYGAQCTATESARSRTRRASRNVPKETLSEATRAKPVASFSIAPIAPAYNCRDVPAGNTHVPELNVGCVVQRLRESPFAPLRGPPGVVLADGATEAHEPIRNCRARWRHLIGKYDIHNPPPVPPNGIAALQQS